VISTDSQRVCVVIDPKLSEIGLMFVGPFLITGVENTQHLTPGSLDGVFTSPPKSTSEEMVSTGERDHSLPDYYSSSVTRGIVRNK
jgi:hypothetical protein